MEAEALGDCDLLSLADGDKDAEGLKLFEALDDGLILADGDKLLLSLADGDRLPLGLKLLLSLAEGLKLLDGDWLLDSEDDGERDLDSLAEGL